MAQRLGIQQVFTFDEHIRQIRAFLALVSGMIYQTRTTPCPPSPPNPNFELAFYREYFKPTREIFIRKDRQRWRVLFRGAEFYMNLDRIEQADLGHFIEVKSCTWSRRDAEHKAELARELLTSLGAAPADAGAKDYVEIAGVIKPITTQVATLGLGPRTQRL